MNGLYISDCGGGESAEGHLHRRVHRLHRAQPLAAPAARPPFPFIIIILMHVFHLYYAPPNPPPPPTPENEREATLCSAEAEISSPGPSPAAVDQKANAASPPPPTITHRESWGSNAALIPHSQRESALMMMTTIEF